MRCIFCKENSLLSRSIEHIIPESLGNTEHVLPPGVVCDKCNNYLAREVEKPLLDSLYFRERRYSANIPNKKNKIPTMHGIHMQSKTPIQFIKRINDADVSLHAINDADESRLISNILQKESGAIVIPIGEKPADYIVSRFIGKVGLEVLAQRSLDVTGGVDEIVDLPALDELRCYVRMGKPKKPWPYLCRSIYRQNYVFKEENELYEVLHEYDILITSQHECYIVVAIYGEEYVLNLGGPYIGGYEDWLRTHKNMSPLYSRKNL